MEQMTTILPAPFLGLQWRALFRHRLQGEQQFDLGCVWWSLTFAGDEGREEKQLKFSVRPLIMAKAIRPHSQGTTAMMQAQANLGKGDDRTDPPVPLRMCCWLVLGSRHATCKHSASHVLPLAGSCDVHVTLDPCCWIRNGCASKGATKAPNEQLRSISCKWGPALLSHTLRTTLWTPLEVWEMSGMWWCDGEGECIVMWQV